MTDDPQQEPGRNEGLRPGSFTARYCATIDALNEWVGRLFGLTILIVTSAVIYEVVARGVFAQGTLWSNETTIYVSAVAYLIAGGYGLRHRRHVRIDVAYQMFSPRIRARLDVVIFVFFLIYAGTLIGVGGQMAWTSFGQRESTGSPWDPWIWPVKMAIPLAGLLLLLQGIADLVRELRASANEVEAR